MSRRTSWYVDDRAEVDHEAKMHETAVEDDPDSYEAQVRQALGAAAPYPVPMESSGVSLPDELLREWALTFAHQTPALIPRLRLIAKRFDCWIPPDLVHRVILINEDLPALVTDAEDEDEDGEMTGDEDEDDEDTTNAADFDDEHEDEDMTGNDDEDTKDAAEFDHEHEDEDADRRGDENEDDTRERFDRRCYTSVSRYVGSKDCIKYLKMRRRHYTTK
ncbi:hypothetical protein B0H14DRAFT_3157588 [Mycena olivaceomarginata]|nr:hypothetical protein B0H14DRAFT_3157588 [Mycena olivaceomarginata]